MNDFLEANQDPSNKRRGQVIDLFIKRAGEKLASAVTLAEGFFEAGSTFERSLADALETLKL